MEKEVIKSPLPEHLQKLADKLPRPSKGRGGYKGSNNRRGGNSTNKPFKKRGGGNKNWSRNKNRGSKPKN